MRNLGNWTTISGIFSQFLYCVCAKMAIKLLLVKFLIPNLKLPWLFPIRIRILAALPPRFIRVLRKKTAFIMQNFRNLGNIGHGGDDTPKRHILA